MPLTTDHFRSPAILSVKVCIVPAKLVFVITASPKLARAVGDYLNAAEHNLAVVWIPSVASACRRLEWTQPSLVVLDEAGESTYASVNALQAAAPGAQMMLLVGGSKFYKRTNDRS